MKKLSLSIICLLLLFLFFGCSTEKVSNALKGSSIEKNIIASDNSALPEQVLEDYFRALNAKDIEKLNTILTKEKQIDKGQLDNIKFVKLESISRFQNDNQKYSYLKGKIINRTDLKNIELYRANFTAQYKNDNIPFAKSGKETWIFVLVKDAADMQWKIKDWGVQ